jgi:hypothetical protein
MSSRKVIQGLSASLNVIIRVEPFDEAPPGTVLGEGFGFCISETGSGDEVEDVRLGDSEVIVAFSHSQTGIGPATGLVTARQLEACSLTITAIVTTGIRKIKSRFMKCLADGFIMPLRQ